MKWEFVEKEIKVGKRKTIKVKDPNKQIDTVGNIVQKQGAIQPKACQKCKKEFTSKIESKPITQSVPFYKCENCEFENAGGDAALDHKITTDHKIKKITKDRLAKVDKIITGRIAHIKKTKTDVKILCGDCNER